MMNPLYLKTYLEYISCGKTSESDSLKQEHSNLVQNYAEALVQIARLQQSADDGTVNADAMQSKVKAELTAAQNQIEALDKLLSGATESKKTIEAQRESLESQVGELTRKVGALEQSLEEMTASMNSHIEAANASTQSINTLKAERDDSIRAHQDALARINDKKASMGKSIEKHESEITGLNAELVKIQAEKTQLQDEIKTQIRVHESAQAANQTQLSVLEQKLAASRSERQVIQISHEAVQKAYEQAIKTADGNQAIVEQLTLEKTASAVEHADALKLCSATGEKLRSELETMRSGQTKCEETVAQQNRTIDDLRRQLEESITVSEQLRLEKENEDNNSVGTADTDVNTVASDGSRPRPSTLLAETVSSQARRREKFVPNRT
jgi:chromosome segregation ATPase